MKYIVKLYLKGMDDVISCEYSGILHDNFDEAFEELLEAQIDTFEDPLVDRIYIQEV